ncbi:hypothetical protein [Chromobacterium sp. Beijing]|uniref:hypothetical protein n=1 Tax=Chromobacterium sp. Beijing TaxID=2735795 RepID=UPI00351CEEAA
MLSALVALSVASHALLGAEQQFNRDALLLSEQLNQKLQSHETVLDSYATFSTLDRSWSLPSEKRLARQLLRRYPQIQWLGHIERISPGQLPMFRQRLKQLYGQALPLPPPAATAGKAASACSRSPSSNPCPSPACWPRTWAGCKPRAKPFRTRWKADGWKSPVRSSCPACRPAIC